MFVYDNTTEKLQVTEISWERIFMKIKIKSELEGNLKFALRSLSRKKIKASERDESERKWGNFYTDTTNDIPVIPEKYEGGYYYLKINMAAADKRSFLENKRWQLVVFDEEGTLYHCSVCYKLAHNIDDYCRVFRYGKNKYAYTVTFGMYTSDLDNTLFSLYFDSLFMKRNDEWEKRKYVEAAVTKKGKRKRRKFVVVITMINWYYKFLRLFMPSKGTNVLFMTETKPYIWGNLLYIDKRMRERGLDKRFNITHSSRVAVGSHSSDFNWLRLVTMIAKQDFIFVDDYVPIFGFLKLDKKTKLIQVWHAGVGFKSVGYSRFGKPGSPFPTDSCHKKYDYAITGSQELVEVYHEVFGIEKSAFLPVGMARLDDFFDEEKINSFKTEFYNEYPELKNKKIILFAPTFRGTGQKSAHYNYDVLDMQQIYDFCGDEYVFAFKMHPFIKRRPDFEGELLGMEDRIVDLSDCENINDLYYVADMLITDYSSAYYEFSLMEKPILFFTYDREKYEIQRGVHKPIKETAPGKVCDTFEELMDALKNKDYELEKTIDFKNRIFEYNDNHAADRAIDELLPLTDEERIY